MKKQPASKRIYTKPICKMVAEIPSGLIVTNRQKNTSSKEAALNDKKEK